MIPLFPSCPVPQEQQKKILQYYQRPLRSYHNLNHIQEMFIQFREVHNQSLWSSPNEIYMALLYHDAIYEYGAKDNEEQSARLAQKDILAHQADQKLNISYITQLIRHTAQHGSLTASELTDDEKLFLDCDMAIVGASTQRYQEYEEQIQQEYTQVYVSFLYRMGRKRFLKKLLRAERIFFSTLFHEKYDKQARKNIETALQKL